MSQGSCLWKIEHQDGRKPKPARTLETVKLISDSKVAGHVLSSPLAIGLLLDRFYQEQKQYL